jgi:hypothetical protein
MPACTKADCDHNQQRAAKINRTRQKKRKSLLAYGAVNVTIVDVVTGSMTFTSDGDNITTGDITFTTAGEDGLKHTYQIARNLIWSECPSTAQNAGESGELYISREGLDAAGTNAGVRIYGTTPDAFSGTVLPIKWPDPGEDPDPPVPVGIWPTSIIVNGFALDDPEFTGEVDLLDADAAGFHQTIQFDRGIGITVNLTGIGRGQFGLGLISEKTGGAELKRALELIATPFNDDEEARAQAWRLIVNWRRYLHWSERTNHNNDSKRNYKHLIEKTLAHLAKSK